MTWCILTFTSLLSVGLAVYEAHVGQDVYCMICVASAILYGAHAGDDYVTAVENKEFRERLERSLEFWAARVDESDPFVQLYKMTKLEDGWDESGMAPAPSKTAIVVACNFLLEGEHKLCLVESVDPDVMGGVAIYYASMDYKRTVWVSIGQEGSITMILKEDGEKELLGPPTWESINSILDPEMEETPEDLDLVSEDSDEDEDSVPEKKRVIGIRCKKCGDTIQSKHRHDFVRCSCKAVAIDGGTEYTKVLWPTGKQEDHFDWVRE